MISVSCDWNEDRVQLWNIEIFCGFKHRLYDFEIDLVTELAAFCILANSRLDEQLPDLLESIYQYTNSYWCLVLERQILFGEQF